MKKTTAGSTLSEMASPIPPCHEAVVGSNPGENSAQKISSEYVDDKKGS
jgi:hypothetical protein